MIINQDKDNSLFTSIPIPIFWYGTCNSGGVVFNAPSNYYDSGEMCKTGKLIKASINIYLQLGNSNFPGGGTITSTNITKYVVETDNPTVPKGSQEFGPSPYNVSKGYTIGTQYKNLKIKAEIATPVFQGTHYAVSYLQLEFDDGSCYIAFLDFGSYTDYGINPPSIPKNLTILSTRDPGSEQVVPDITLQWTAASNGSAPIAGYNIYWGSDPASLGNSMTLSLGQNTLLQYNKGNNTYTFNLPYGTLQPFAPGDSTDQYYFSVNAFDDGTGSFYIKNGSTARWYKEQWFPATDNPLSVCKMGN